MPGNHRFLKHRYPTGWKRCDLCVSVDVVDVVFELVTKVVHLSQFHVLITVQIA